MTLSGKLTFITAVTYINKDNKNKLVHNVHKISK